MIRIIIFIIMLLLNFIGSYFMNGMVKQLKPVNLSTSNAFFYFEVIYIINLVVFLIVIAGII